MPILTRIRPCIQRFGQAPLLSLCWLVALTASVWPFWASALLPFQDLPQHLATVRVLHSYHDPAFGVSHYFAIALGRTQYLAWYFLVDWLTYLLPLETAARVVFSLYAIGVPLSLAALLRAHRRDLHVALLSIPLIFNPFLFMGLANYVTALPLVFWALALLQRLLDAFTWRRFLLLTAVTTLIFYDHAQAFLLYVALAGVTTLLGAPGLHPRHWCKQLLHLLPSGVAMLVWLQKSLILASAQEWHQGLGGRNVAPPEARWKPIAERLTDFMANLSDVYHDDLDEKLLVSLLILLGVAWVLGRDRVRTQQPSVRETLRDHLPEMLLVTAFFIYLASPYSWKWIAPLAERLIPAVALLAIPAFARHSMPFRTWTLAIPATVLAVMTAKVHADHAQAFSAEAGPIRQVVAQAEKGKRLMALIFQSQSAVMKQPVYLHFGQYYVIDRGGMANFSFANFPQSPVLFPDVGGPPLVPPRFEWTPEVFTMATQGYWYDYFLIRDENLQRNPFGAERAQVELVTRQGPWALYKNLQPAPLKKD